MNKMIVIFLALLLNASMACASIPVVSESYKASKVEVVGDVLKVSTGQIERVWQWTGKGLVTISLKNAESGREWATAHPKQMADWNLGDLGDGKLVSLKAFEDDDEKFTSKHLAIEAEIHYAKLHIKYVIWAYPNAPGIRTQLWLKSPKNVEWNKELFQPDVSESLNLKSEPKSVTAFGYMAGIKTPMKHLILREEPLPVNETADWASGLVIDDHQSGIVVIKESHKHTHMDHGDLVTGNFKRNDSGVEVTGIGIRIPDLKTDRYRFGWANWVILYNGNRNEAELTLKRFDRLRFPVNFERDIYVMANTWGTEDMPAPCKYKAREENVLKELDSCAELGIDILQIDDGWQNNQWRPKTKAKDRFTVHTGERIDGIYDVYPNGFGKVRARAEELGVKLGLWHAWKAPIESIKANYDEGNFKGFKLDFAQLKQKDDFDMLYRKARELVKYSDYTAAVNWDVTEIAPRMGYYFGRDCGNLYLENRKSLTIRENVQYVPFKVLRDAWLLAKYVNLNKIQITFQNKDHTPAEAKSDALKYTHSYNLGITLMSSPIFFLETQYLNKSAREQIKAILEPYKAQREQMYQGYVFGIGDVPDNASWTGFQNYHPETQEGYLTVFRELNNKNATAKLALHFYQPGTKLQLIDLLSGKSSDVILDSQGQAEFIIAEAPGFQFLKVIRK